MVPEIHRFYSRFLVVLMVLSLRSMNPRIPNIRQQFPIFSKKDCVYLDNAATSQKPEVVINSMNAYYETINANVHRGMHELAEKATIAFEDARKTVANFIGSAAHEVIFTKGTTESLNLIAKSWGKANITKEDTIVLSVLEHHSNIIPWQQLQMETGCTIEWIDIDDDGNLKLEELDAFLKTGKVKLVSITGQSNVLGTCPPLKEIGQKVHAAGALYCIDAAQLSAHKNIDVTKIDCDFLAFSGHKIYGPTGIGILYSKKELLEAMPPFLGGGMMIQEVTKEGFTTAEIPAKFEAGTPPIAEAVGLKAAINWITECSWDDISLHDKELCTYAIEKLSTIEGLSILGTPTECIISFTIDNVHPHDLTEIIGRKGVSMRAGHHCAQPLHVRLGINASTRLSIGIYNTTEDIDTAVTEIKNAIQVLRPA
jgi:cysteine desulfurase / selenocysteine lyase